jgi:hypothetical protein
MNTVDGLSIYLPKGANYLVHPKVNNFNGIISNTAQQEVSICKQHKLKDLLQNWQRNEI